MFGRAFCDVIEDKANKIPGVRHVDCTARVQTINPEQNPAYYDLIKAFYKRTGVPFLINTSF
jgi:carbamoyltransferase